MAAPIVADNFSLIETGTLNPVDLVTNLHSPVVVGGKLWQYKAVLGAGATSKALLIPQGRLLDILLHALTGAPTVYQTLSNPADIPLGLAVWETVSISGITTISLAVSALYVVADGSGETVLVNVRAN